MFCFVSSDQGGRVLLFSCNILSKSFLIGSVVKAGAALMTQSLSLALLWVLMQRFHGEHWTVAFLLFSVKHSGCLGSSTYFTLNLSLNLANVAKFSSLLNCIHNYFVHS